MSENESAFTLNYSFTAKEIKLLAKFLRKNETELPHGLENFAKTLENSVYDCMTLEEVKEFYS
ncbi:hypothetical protein MSI_23480 [Treponema sp. JC4]|uniref:hypothetical protein n=1 Tax=Treponema sp. JC4 TaxID=1124982 RepID=UPI00025B0AF8|nr:hypothetical protein [Treponema sp. JC4]EID84204.1 hypothetical protein MSI_23480 [Treponema sp. JC4]